jgi:hypothetical protein
VRALRDGDGALEWTFDLTPALTSLDAATRTKNEIVNEPVRAAGASSSAPATPLPNLLATGAARLSIGGTPGWKSQGKLQVEASSLYNGRTDDNDTPWLSLPEQYWDAVASRKVWIEIELDHPTDLHSLTVHENPAHPEAWPTAAVVQAWDERDMRWRTVKYAAFLHGSVARYPLSLRGVKKVRYVPWGSYFRNFYTSEIELR